MLHAERQSMTNTNNRDHNLTTGIPESANSHNTGVISMSNIRVNCSTNLSDDIYYLVEYASATRLLEKSAKKHSCIKIDKLTVEQMLYSAVGFLAQGGVSASTVWALDDLVTPKAFTLILQNASCASSAKARCIGMVLLTTAEEWVGVGPNALAELKAIAERFPGPDTGRGKTIDRSNALWPLLTKATKKRVSKALTDRM